MAITVALGLLLTPIKNLGKAFLAIKDYFANNTWGDIGKDIGVGLLAALGLKIAGGLLFTKISSMIMTALMPAGATLGAGGVPTAGAMGAAFIKAIPILALIAGIGKTIFDTLKGIKLAEEWGVDKLDAGIGAAIGGTGSGWTGAITNALAKGGIGAGVGFMVGGPVGALVGGLIGIAFGAITGYLGG